METRRLRLAAPLCALAAAVLLLGAGCSGGSSYAGDGAGSNESNANNGSGGTGGGNEAQMPNGTDGGEDQTPDDTDDTESSEQTETYTVTFDSGNGNAVAPQQVEKGQMATPVTDPTKEGYKFLGWYLGGEEFDFNTPITANITLTARWLIHGTYGYLTIANGVVTRCATSATGHITIPEGVTGIGEEAFLSCRSLASVTIPDSVTSIGHYAFQYCSSLASITIPDSVTSIGYAAFFRCESLTSITIPVSVKSIEEFAFWNCTSLASVTIPASVESIGKSAFNDCKELTDVYYGGSGAAWEELMRNTGSNNDPLQNATIHYDSTGA